MKNYPAAGLILIIVGIVMICIRSFTYFSHEQQVGPLGFFAWDVAQPHTIFINPAIGLLAVVIGFALMLTNRSRTAL